MSMNEKTLSRLCKLLSPSAHQTPNLTNPEFTFSQFKALQSVFFFFMLRIILRFLGVI